MIDFEAFIKSFENFDTNLKKTKEREKKAAIRKRHRTEENFKENAKNKKRMADNSAKQSVDEKRMRRTRKEWQIIGQNSH